MQDSNTLLPTPPPPSSMNSGRGKTRWWIPLAIVGGLIVLFVACIAVFIGVVASGISSDKKTVDVRNHSVLMLDLSGGLPEHSPALVLPFMGNKRGASLFDVLTAIRRASKDSKIDGIYYRAGGDGIGYAKLAEVRDALLQFKKSGKFIYAFIEVGSKSHYYIASVADSIFMPQEGLLEFTSYGASAPFMKGMFEKLGVDWHVQQYEEYKSAAESFSRTSWSEPAKRELRELLAQRHRMFVDAVSESRKISPMTVARQLDSGLVTSDELLRSKLIDGISMENDLRDRVNARLDTSSKKLKRGKMRSVSVSQYLEAENGDDAEGANKTIAIVYASGAIGTGKNDDPFGGEGIYPKNLIADLRRAADDDDVEGIILRIDSPGGSVIGSDEIWNEIKQIRAKKPVYASMSDVAASGGYYIAIACDTIIAHPATITGSIGVILAIPNLSGTMQKIGVTMDTVSLGASSNIMNNMMPFSPMFKKRLDDIASPIYHRFVQKVADARKKTFDEARSVAKGRVWTGEAALAEGLIDVSGGLRDAITLMKKRIGVAEDGLVKVKSFPEDLDQIEAILKLFGIGDSDEDEGQAAAPRRVTSMLKSAVSDETAVAHVWKSLPPNMKQHVRHAAALTDIGLREQAMVMLPTLIITD